MKKRLQYVGEVPAIPASEMKVGDVRMYNFGVTSLIIKIIEKSPKTLTIITVNEKGEYYMSDIRKDTLVCIVRRGEDVSEHKPTQVYKVSGRNKGWVNVEEYFPQTKVEKLEEEQQPTEIPVKVDSSERNTRYIAQQNPGVIIEHGQPVHEGGFQFLSYRNYFPYDNPYDRTGYIAVDVVSYQGKKYMLDSEAEYPDIQRKMKGKRIIFDTYQEAKTAAIEEIKLLEEWVKSDWWNEQPECLMTQEEYQYELDNYGYRIHTKHDGTNVIRFVGDHLKVKYGLDLDKYKHVEFFRVRIV
jgi:hypothetical protein